MLKVSEKVDIEGVFRSKDIQMLVATDTSEPVQIPQK